MACGSVHTTRSLPKCQSGGETVKNPIAVLIHVWFFYIFFGFFLNDFPWFEDVNSIGLSLGDSHVVLRRSCESFPSWDFGELLGALALELHQELQVLTLYETTAHGAPDTWDVGKKSHFQDIYLGLKTENPQILLFISLTSISEI